MEKFISIYFMYLLDCELDSDPEGNFHLWRKHIDYYYCYSINGRIFSCTKRSIDKKVCGVPSTKWGAKLNSIIALRWIFCKVQAQRSAPTRAPSRSTLLGSPGFSRGCSRCNSCCQRKRGNSIRAQRVLTLGSARQPGSGNRSERISEPQTKFRHSRRRIAEHASRAAQLKAKILIILVPIRRIDRIKVLI